MFLEPLHHYKIPPIPQILLPGVITKKARLLHRTIQKYEEQLLKMEIMSCEGEFEGCQLFLFSSLP